jgi:hypothetical protein
MRSRAARMSACTRERAWSTVKVSWSVCKAPFSVWRAPRGARPCARAKTAQNAQRKNRLFLRAPRPTPHPFSQVCAQRRTPSILRRRRTQKFDPGSRRMQKRTSQLFVHTHKRLGAFFRVSCKLCKLSMHACLTCTKLACTKLAQLAQKTWRVFVFSCFRASYAS